MKRLCETCGRVVEVHCQCGSDKLLTWAEAQALIAHLIATGKPAFAAQVLASVKSVEGWTE